MQEEGEELEERKEERGGNRRREEGGRTESHMKKRGRQDSNLRRLSLIDF